ncbi:unnamed protein product, partial [Lota lota]
GESGRGRGGEREGCRIRERSGGRRQLEGKEEEREEDAGVERGGGRGGEREGCR